MLYFSIKGKVTDPSGALVQAVIHSYSRGGSRSPELWVIAYGGRRITPFEQRVRNWLIPVPTLLRLIYHFSSESIGDLIYKDNPLLRMLPKQ